MFRWMLNRLLRPFGGSGATPTVPPIVNDPVRVTRVVNDAVTVTRTINDPATVTRTINDPVAVD